MGNEEKAVHRQDASAWLIKKFIDKDSTFDFMDEKEMETIG